MRDAGLSETPQGVTGSPRVSYAPRVDATPKGELSALAAVYKIILERHQRKNDAGTERGQEEGEEAAERNRTGGIISEERL